MTIINFFSIFVGFSQLLTADLIALAVPMDKIDDFIAVVNKSEQPFEFSIFGSADKNAFDNWIEIENLIDECNGDDKSKKWWMWAIITLALLGGGLLIYYLINKRKETTGV